MSWSSAMRASCTAIRLHCDEAVQRWNIRWAIVPNRGSELGRLLAKSPEWRLLKKDGVGAIYVRSSAEDQTYVRR